MNKRDNLAFDASKRDIDEKTGFMRVSESNISKATVNQYHGHEIPGYQDLGLDADEIYYVYRPADELEKAASSFNGLPLLMGHSPESADDPQRDYRVGSLGSEVYFDNPYLKSWLIITDADAIRAIDSGIRELSAAYTYTPVLEAGEFDGVPYSIKMTNIHGNHVAIVPEGRVGADACVADEKPQRKGLIMGALEEVKKILTELTGGERDEKREATAAELGVGDNEKEAMDESDDEIIKEIGQMLYALEDRGDDEELALKIKEEIIPRLRELKGVDAEDNDKVGEDEEDKEAEDSNGEENKQEADETEGLKLGSDGKPKRRKMSKQLPTVDAAAIRREVESGIRARHDAARNVAPVLGYQDPFSFATANDIYRAALEELSLDYRSIPQDSWGAVATAMAQKQYGLANRDWADMASDSKATRGLPEDIIKIKYDHK